MQEKKTLTFVVPAYNMTEYLERCVESLIASKRNDDIEVLIVDDGSSDGTLEMAKTFEARNPGIVRAIHQENKGHGGAVNTGKFCSECGAKRPAGAPVYRCDKCGWQPADPAHPPKFCPECGDPFDDHDKV